MDSPKLLYLLRSKEKEKREKERKKVSLDDANDYTDDIHVLNGSNSIDVSSYFLRQFIIGKTQEQVNELQCNETRISIKRPLFVISLYRLVVSIPTLPGNF